MFGLFMLVLIVLAVKGICWLKEGLEEYQRSGNWRQPEYTEPVYPKVRKYRHDHYHTWRG